MGVYSFVFGWFKTKTRQFWSVPFVDLNKRIKAGNTHIFRDWIVVKKNKEGIQVVENKQRWGHLGWNRSRRRACFRVCSASKRAKQEQKDDQNDLLMAETIQETEGIGTHF